MRVLIVDDSAPMRELLRHILKRGLAPTAIAEAEDGADAIRQATTFQPQLILLDVRMPVMDGFEALPRLREVAPHARIVMVTGLDRAEHAARAFALGAHGFVEKDAPPAQFQAQLVQLAEGTAHVEG